MNSWNDLVLKAEIDYRLDRARRSWPARRPRARARRVGGTLAPAPSARTRLA